MEEYGSIDYLLNNAGFAKARPNTQDGFEARFGSMHVGHALLTKVLLEGRNTASPKHMRIVNVASGMSYYCFPLNCFPNEFFEKDIFTENATLGYPRAKLGNIPHAWALPMHYENVTSFSIPLGFVGTDIAGPFRRYRSLVLCAMPKLVPVRSCMPF